MDSYEIITHSDKETKNIAKTLAAYLKPGDVITLEGDLGAGKTTFTKGIAKGLDIERVVSSPTFTIIKEYEGKYPLYHMDAYRLEYSDEDIGFVEYFEGDGVSVFEWAHFIEEYLPEEYLNITISFISAESRRISFQSIGQNFEELLQKLFHDKQGEI